MVHTRFIVIDVSKIDPVDVHWSPEVNGPPRIARNVRPCTSRLRSAVISQLRRIFHAVFVDEHAALVDLLR